MPLVLRNHAVKAPITKSWSRLHIKHQQHRIGDNEDSPDPKKGTGNPGSSSPHHKPYTSSVTSDEKVDYVQVDKEKTQALQTTIHKWTD
ncbi:hypothetical protein A6R68_13671, partial [Neotoma lepida]